MGLYLLLNLTPTVTAEQWERFWCDSFEILRKFPLRLVRPSTRKTPYEIQKIWTNDLSATGTNGEYWEIAGDTESLMFGEPVRLYRDIEYYRKKWSRFGGKHFENTETTVYQKIKDVQNRPSVSKNNLPVRCFCKFPGTTIFHERNNLCQQNQIAVISPAMTTSGNKTLQN